jgi:hypothetical protein
MQFITTKNIDGVIYAIYQGVNGTMYFIKKWRG